MTIRALLLVVVLGVAGCATTYQPFQLFGTGGYQEKRISADTYQVVYYGNHVTSMQALNSLLLYRSAELTVASGYDYFEVLKGVARMPLSSLGGFRTTEHTIKMFKGETPSQSSGISRTYGARRIMEEFGPQINQQK